MISYLASRLLLIAFIVICPSLGATHLVTIKQEGPDGVLVRIMAENLNAAGTAANGNWDEYIALPPFGTVTVEVPDTWYQVDISNIWQGASGQYHSAIGFTSFGANLQSQGMTGAQREKHVFFLYQVGLACVG